MLSRWATILLLGILSLAACSSPGALATNAPTAPATAAPVSGTPGLTRVNIIMGYVPNVQFAPFFVADQKGYFAQQGLDLNKTWGLETDGIKLVGAQQADFAIVGGDQVLQARSQGIPIVYVANWYNAYPTVIFSLADKNIRTPQDLIGKKVGMPCFCGATYTGWRALLYSQKIDESKINVVDIGFTQAQAVLQGAVDAAGGYANNEPIQLELTGKGVNQIKVWEYARVVGNGIAVSEKTLAERPDLVRRFLRAFLSGVRDSIADPDQAYRVSTAFYPEFGGSNAETSKRVLAASVDLWKNTRLGYTDPADWQAMAQFMLASGMIKQQPELSKAFTDQLVP